jgi:hypothetical protein
MTPQQLAADLGLDPADPIVLRTCTMLSNNINEAAACRKLAGMSLSDVRLAVGAGTVTMEEATAYFKVWVIGKSSYRWDDKLGAQALSAKLGPSGEDVWHCCSVLG